MKIYTKKGDKGYSQFSNKIISKENNIFNFIGNIDELNSLIGYFLANFEKLKNENNFLNISNYLITIQTNLFTFNAMFHNALISDSNKITLNHVLIIEKEIDFYQNLLKPIKNFILPNGSILATISHLLRTKTREVERSFYLAKTELDQIYYLDSNLEQQKIFPLFINRLSDYFFVLARYINQLDNKQEFFYLN